MAPNPSRRTARKRSKDLFDVDAATKELNEKSIDDIERATAITWGGRACAAFTLAAGTSDTEARRQWLMDGENYRQEAIEHAAMTGDVAFIQQVFDEVQQRREHAVEVEA